ncbi:hypothetical protein [Ketogulonicigenium vulgare]|uniref:Uncharacterized protein n=1 Tax=Ketogulonicigenium vulgare (strain WSH-001) TaxID=759362 RepID=F9YAU7_KETVW|nr:hypothetical protein [Ketogulonicigenium vulgare]ADO43972.1 hypothetical protein EIO_2902 [Ketogulonicigenium vulgare Y25]AEM42499.1 hypothetical protein KVU_PA0079 [Ketogulonicigenium vulgare WSH-001]ALJ82541.1 hypothetical protein KVH_14630 [Ketogulonicigenium vulgare]AOZ53204.1 hypothetical protein KVC_0178 [Ketogulonicigenium vulgare]
MAKENKRGNREVKKPKQVKATTAVAVPLFEKAARIGADAPKKKKS